MIMCGIVGIHGSQQDSWIEDMNRQQVHRGPDDYGIFRDREENFSVAMRRLAILDILAGKQPMTTQDGRYTIVFNGEIYNAPQLRRDLEASGVQFITDHSDTEVVLRLYALEQEKALQKLNGMFAFVIYDKDKKILFLARDHMGIKPLHYFHANGVFAFASELKSLLGLSFMRREIDMQSLFHYMSLQYVPGENTIIKGIRRLPSAHYALYDMRRKTLVIKEWWRPKFLGDTKRGLKEWKEIVRAGLDAAVKRWILSDVTIGCSLSGGMDSSSIVAFLAKAGIPIKTYSLGFVGKGESRWNELPAAAKVAKKWGTDHHELILNPEILLEDLVSMVWHLDEPYGGGLPSWNVFKFMSKDVKVGLTGSGGDEMFGNYGKWRYLERKSLYNFFIQNDYAPEKDFRRKFFERFYYFSDAEKKEYINIEAETDNTCDFLYDYFESSNAENVRDKIAYTDLKTQLPEEFLMMTDRFSMAHSFEARTPFLDKEFVELVLSVPSQLRTRRRSLKYLLRDAVKDLLPREILRGRKKGFVIPIKLWLRGRLRKLTEYLLSPKRLERQGIFKRNFYEDFVLPHIEGKKDYTNKVWSALMFQLWYYIFIEANAKHKPSFTWEAIIK